MEIPTAPTTKMHEVNVIQELDFDGQKASLSFNTPFGVTSGTNIATICAERTTKTALDIWKMQLQKCEDFKNIG